MVSVVGKTEVRCRSFCCVCVCSPELWKVCTHETSLVGISSQRGALYVLVSAACEAREVISVSHGELGVWPHFPFCATVRNASIQQSSIFPLMMVMAAKSGVEIIGRCSCSPPPVSGHLVHLLVALKIHRSLFLSSFSEQRSEQRCVETWLAS